MFTGIVKAVSTVKKVIPSQGQLKIQVARPIVTPHASDFSTLKAGDSVALDGLCLTLENVSKNFFTFHLGPQTLNITGFTVESLKSRQINLEPALKVGDFVGGHFVTGHVDGMAKILALKPQGKSILLKVKLPKPFQKYIWPKAFITLNGLSLTVNKVQKQTLNVCLIPETLKRSNLKTKKVGDLLTFEVDILARALVSKA